MSLIIYKDGVLAADRLGTVQPFTTYSNLQEMKKLFVCKTGRMAVAFCGDNIHEESMQHMMDIFSIALMAWEAAGKNIAPALTDEQMDIVLGDRCYFIMTKDDCWAFDSREHGKSFQHLSCTTQCRGNGAWMGYVGLAAGMSPGLVIEKVGEVNPEVGTFADVYSQDKLLPLITPPPTPEKPARKPRTRRTAK